MTKMYFILSVAGWAWLVLVAIFLVFRLLVKRGPVKGFDVVSPRVDVPTGAPGGEGRAE